MPLAPPPLRVLVDADTANEVDDLFAITRAFSEPRFNVVALTGSQYLTQNQAPPDSAAHSHKLNQRLLAVMGRSVPTAEGSNTAMLDDGAPIDSPAARLIIEHARAATPQDPLYVFTLGAVTNVASAIRLAPDIVPNLRLWSIMLKYDEASGWRREEFNANNDQNAVDVLFSTPGLDLTIMTATASRQLKFSRAEVDEKLANRSDLGRFLVAHWDDFVGRMTWNNETWTKDRSWIMFDVALVEALLDPTLAELRRVPPPALKNGNTAVPEVKVFTRIDAAGMTKRFWHHVAP